MLLRYTRDMTTQVSELYQALRAAGVADDLAGKAAAAVVSIEDKSQLATKSDLLALETALTKTIYQTTWTAMVVMTAIYAAISTALRFVRP